MIRKLTVYDGDTQYVRNALADVGGFRIAYAEDESVPVDSDCVLLVQDLAGEKLVERIRALRKLLIPVAVATCDGSAQNQEFLIDCGADDVIVFPLPAKLLQKRLEALAGVSVFSQDDVDFSAFDRIHEANQGKGSFIVQEHDFANIYRFVMRLLERLDQKAQLIIFTFTSDCGPVIESESIGNFMRIVQACLRRGDISSVCGRQVFMILIGANELGGHTVIQRVLNAYAAHYDDDSCEITFDMREISSK